MSTVSSCAGGHRPGDLVQVDTLDVAVLPGLRRKQFTARDMVSRYDVVEAYGRATAHTATAFLDLLLRRPEACRSSSCRRAVRSCRATSNGRSAHIERSFTRQIWAHIYNTIRPHQHLKYLTPLEYCERHT